MSETSPQPRVERDPALYPRAAGLGAQAALFSAQPAAKPAAQPAVDPEVQPAVHWAQPVVVQDSQPAADPAIAASSASDPPATTLTSRTWPAPWVFALMPLPYGVYMGYLQTPLPYLLRRAGYSVDRIGAIVAFVLLPMTLYFLWSPVVDFGLRRRTWMVLLAALSGLTLLSGILLLPHHTDAATTLLAVGFGINLLTTSCGGGLMAHTQPAPARAAAWMQGGGLAATALGGAALLFLSGHVPLPALALIAAAMVAIPALIALTIPEPAPPPIRTANGTTAELTSTLRTMLQEIRHTLFSWRSLPGILLLVAPVGSGAAASLFAAMATDYHVGEHGVLLLNGLLGGVLTMLGAFAAVILPPRLDRRLAYAAAGLACAATGLLLALAPMRPATYFVGVALYLLTTGTCYGLFLGVVMLTLGEAGRSASSRYTLLVSLGNLPIVYMTRVEAWGYHAFGPRGVPALDAAGNLLVALASAAWLLTRHRRAGHLTTASDPVPATLESEAIPAGLTLAPHATAPPL